MGEHSFPHLFTPVGIGPLELKNRIFITGHETGMVHDNLPTDDMVAYHEARAAGGAGLLIVEVAIVHPTAVYAGHCIHGFDERCEPWYRRIAQAVKPHGCRVFAQLFHPGREVYASADGTAALTYAPSQVPNERFHTMPRAFPKPLIREIVRAFGGCARRLKDAGMDGIEVLASHGYLPAQFLNPSLNRRDDEYGGDLDNRLRFLREVVASVRAAVGPDTVVGLRISGEEYDHDGLDLATAAAACEALDRDGVLDYFNVCAGSSATLAGSFHIVPPMFLEAGYTAPFAAAVKAKVKRPVLVAGRINQPHIAEQVIASGQADLCGMTRAHICDPQMSNKARTGRAADIRACIACNQACVGHLAMGVPISCIQHPESGRERRYARRHPAAARKRVLVAGGGPAGMKAAAVTAERGHEVVLCERAAQPGGQVLLAQLLPDRTEFGGLVTNLEREMQLAGVELRRNTPVDRALVEREAPDAVIIATGAHPWRPALEGEEDAHVLDAWQVLRGEANVGARVLVADWRCDWVGMGLAEKLAREGCHVRLAVNGYAPGQSVQQYVRDHWAGKLHKLGVEVITYARLYGADRDSVYLQHITSGEPIVCEGVDTLVLALGHASETTLERELEGWPGQLLLAGDCLAPRTAEEAVLEGLKAGVAV